MKKQVRQGLTLVLALLMCMAALTACGGGSEKQAETNPAPAAAAPAATISPEQSAEAPAPPAETPEAGGTKKLGVICIDLNLPFYVEMMESGTEASQDYGVESIWKSAEGNIDTEIALIDSFIEQKVDCILVDPIDVVALEPAVQRAHDAGIATISMGNVIQVDGNVSTVYPDHDNCKVIGELMCEMIGGKGDVAIMVGTPGNYVSDQRQSGFEDAIKQYPDVKAQYLVSNYDAPTGLQKAQEVVASTPELKAFACVTDDVTMGAAQALPKEVMIFSHDGSLNAMENVDKGVWQCTNLTGSKRVGYWNVVVGAALANGQKTPDKIFLPTHLILNDASKKVAEEKGLAKGLSIIPASEGAATFNGYRQEFAPGKYIVPAE